MDKTLRAAILAEVRRAMAEVNERWVTAEQLSEHVGTLTPRFLQSHGQMFNRTRVEFTEKDGTRHAQGWLYPLNEIKTWIANGKIKELHMH